MKAYKDRITETKRVKERKRARVERGAGDVPRYTKTEMMSRWRFDRRTHLAVTSDLDIEPDLRRTPLINNESGCNTNTKAVSTPREKLQDKLV